MSRWIVTSHDASRLRFPSAQKSSAALGCNLAGAIGDRAVDQHAFDTDRKRFRLLERCDILDRVCIENDDVSVRAFADFAAIVELEVARGEAAHLVHGGLERKQSQLAAVMP